MISKIIVLCFFFLCSCGEDDHVKVFDLPEGSNCVWNGLEGNCTNINNCQSAKDAIQRKSHPPICSFQGMMPIVCCTISKTKLILTDPFKEFEVDSRFNRTSKARDNCLKYLKTLDYPCSAPRPYEQRSLSDQNRFDTVTPSPLDNAQYPRSLEDLTSALKPLAENQTDALPYPQAGAPSIGAGVPAYRRQYPHMTDAPPYPQAGVPTIGAGVPAYRRQYPHMTDAPPYPQAGVPTIGAGVPAYRRQYPHMALLGYGDDIKTAQWLCGGSVISEKYILTAAHCISSPAVGPVRFIALGILKRSDPPELWQTHNVKRIISHPEYKPPSKYNDIALLESENPITFNSNILPACLPLVPESDEIAEATGWGALGHRQGLADILQTVKLQRYDEEKCSQLYPKHRHLREGYNHSSQICYGDTEGAKDTCEGDSGGPLQTSNEFLPCAYTVLGVTSYGRQCGVSAGSGMYTRVYRYVPWLESQVWP